VTTSKVEERGRAARRVEWPSDTVVGAILLDLLEMLPPERPEFPLVEYQARPGDFAREILGVALMPEQTEVLEAIRGNLGKKLHRVAVRGGRKVGKDFVLAVAAIWFYCSFPGARVRFTAVKQDQVDGIFWRELRLMLANHGRCVECKRSAPSGPRPCPHSRIIPEAEEVAKLARTGLKAPDFREIVGYTAREAEGAAGVSGAYQLNIVDEASGVDDFSIDAIEGNMAGCVLGRLALISNPTRTLGAFFRAFHEERDQWDTFHRSSEDIARKYGGRIPGIATREWIETMVEKYGATSDFFEVQVRGNFPKSAAGTIFDVHSIEQAFVRWHSAPDNDGPLYIGVDVAGESGTGDESAFAARRSKKVLSLHARIGLSPETHLTEILALIARHRERNCPVVVVVDRGGEAGAKVYGTLVAFRQSQWQDPPFDLVGVDSSRLAQRDPKAYKRIRDELVANLADWVRSGGGLPEDTRLASELHEFRWIEQKIGNQNQLVDKRTMRERLGRSPDRADAVALACWAEKHWTPATATEAAAPVETEPQPSGDMYDDADTAMRMMREEMMRGPGRGF
jgi:hypothetical protein